MDISGKIEANQVTVYRDVSNVAEALNIRFVVVGAAARDLVLHYGYGARVVRATADIDFGVQVADATAYNSVMARLVGIGYVSDDMPHRLISQDGITVDLVPFGPIATAGGEVVLPPDDTHRMSIVGFQEACDSADQVIIQSKPEVVVPVASPAGVTLLKLIAWTDRAADLKVKDANDLAYLMENYEKIPEVAENLYDHTAVLESFDWDLTLAGASALGTVVNTIASEQSQDVIARLRNGDIRNRTVENLRFDMCRNGNDDSEAERKGAILDAFFSGFDN